MKSYKEPEEEPGVTVNRFAEGKVCVEDLRVLVLWFEEAPHGKFNKACFHSTVISST